MESPGDHHRIFHCWRCSVPIVLPFDTLVPQQSVQAPHTTEVPHVVAICPNCKLAGIYSEDKRSPHYRAVNVVGGTLNKALDHGGSLECEKGDICQPHV